MPQENVEVVRRLYEEISTRLDVSAEFFTAGDAEVGNRYFNAWTFRNGKVVRVSSHTDRKRALQAAGLRA